MKEIVEQIFMDRITEVRVEYAKKRVEASNIYEAREAAADISSAGKEVPSEATVIVLTYNNQLEKTKRCCESVLKYTTDVDYDLILIDNGSGPEMMEYFKTIEHPKKRIIHLHNNMGSAFPCEILSMNMLGEFVTILAFDLILTKNWLSNLIKVFRSDPKIGLVNPVCSNTSNLQCVELQYSNYEEMQEKAAAFNISDPTKWQERLRIITLGYTLRKSCIYAIGWPVNDVGFMHNFMDDDLAFRVRRMGYKVVVAGDTWICHDHIRTEKELVKLREDLKRGRADFQQKYRGIDAWDDVNNFIFHSLGNKIKKVDTDSAKILGIDVKCGTPILDIKNVIRKYGIYDAELSAFTTDEKYVEDLRTICNGIVACDREEFIPRRFLYAYYDYIIMDKPLNAYHEPMNVLMDAFMLLKPGGQLIFTLKNTNNAITLLKMLGYGIPSENEYYYNYPIDALMKDMQEMGNKVSVLMLEHLQNIDKSVVNMANEMLKTYCRPEMLEEMSRRMMLDRIWLSMEK